METQDPKKPNPSGTVCHKCGWPFPKAHPSAKHRRAHKKVCGTIEGYKLDNNDGSNSSAQDKVQGDGSDAERGPSDDDLKTPMEGDKVVERMISTRSSGGLGSRSSRSAQSEEDMFTDAVTEFIDSPATGNRNSSDGGLQRFYSTLNQNELDIANQAEGDSVADSLYTSDQLKDNRLQSAQILEGESDKAEAAVASDDHFSANASLAGASVTLKNENAFEQNKMQFSKSSSVLDVATEGGKEIMSGEADKVLEDESTSKDAEEKLLDPVTAGGMLNVKGTEFGGIEGKIERFDGAASPGGDKIENFPGVVSTAKFHSPSQQEQVIDSGKGDTSKPFIIERHSSEILVDENINFQSVPDALSLPGISEVAVEDLDHTRGKINNVKAPYSTLSAESLELGKAHSMMEGNSGFDLTNPTEGDGVCFQDDAVNKIVDSMEEDELKLEDEEKYMAEQKSCKEPDQTGGVKATDSVIDVYRSEEGYETVRSIMSEDKTASCTEEQKPIAQNVFPEGATIAQNDDELFALRGLGNEVSEDDFAVGKSVFDKPAIGEVPLQAEELMNTRETSGMADEVNLKLKGSVLNGNEERSEKEEENISVSTETKEANSSVALPQARIDEPKEPEKSSDNDKLDIMSDTRDVMLDHSAPESLQITQLVKEVENFGDDSRREDNLEPEGAVTYVCPDLNLEVVEDASLLRSDAVDDSSAKKSPESTSCVTDGERLTKLGAAVPAVDTVIDSGSLADSLDGNWGSVSVKSATSDTQHGARASNHSQTSVGEENESFELKPAAENQNPPIQMLVKPQAETISEIQSSKDQLQTSALQTGWSSATANVANDPHRGKSDDEIIAKVTNWSSGKQHMALKTLLGEATAKSRAESPIHHSQSSTPKRQAGEIPSTNNGLSAKSGTVDPGSKQPEMETAKEDMGKEWNSPARYPVNIKTEKRRTKSRPIWAPFLCCSSVNAR